MTSWQQRTNPIKVGDKACYSAKHLRSTGQHTGEAPHARGIVTGLKPLGQTMLAVIDWQGADLPDKLNVANLSLVTHRGIAE